jgi:hypothetical protein
MTPEPVGSGRSDLFYNDLAPFCDFAEFVAFDAYDPVPDDWVVTIADIRGSTRAIEAGRYKDVNMVGAASINAVLNICGDIEVPFVFGGDGGTVVVPGSLRNAACDALIGLQAISRTTFGLALRVGAIAVADLRAKGAEVRVRKYELSAGNHLAMFAGGGIELADSLLKRAAPGSRYLLAARSQVAAPDLQGLSAAARPRAGSPRHRRPGEVPEALPRRPGVLPDPVLVRRFRFPGRILQCAGLPGRASFEYRLPQV